MNLELQMFVRGYWYGRLQEEAKVPIDNVEVLEEASAIRDRLRQEQRK